MIGLFGTVGALLLALGAWHLSTSAAVVELTQQYDNIVSCPKNGQCTFDMKVPTDMVRRPGHDGVRAGCCVWAHPAGLLRCCVGCCVGGVGGVCRAVGWMLSVRGISDATLAHKVMRVHVRVV